MSKIRIVRGLGFALAILLFTTPAQANMLIPVMVLSWFGLFMLFVPIVLAEALILWLQPDLSFLRSLWVAGFANLGSTVLGIPVAMIFYRAVATDAPRGTRTWFKKLHYAVFVAPWEVGIEEPPEEMNRDWVAFVATATILAVFFAGSWVSEAIVAQYILDEFQPARVWTATAIANAVTYCAIGAYVAYSVATAGEQTSPSYKYTEPGTEDIPGDADLENEGVIPEPDHRDAA